MQFKYFKVDWNTPIEEAKRQYHKLALEHHPDRCGNEDAIKIISALVNLDGIGIEICGSFIWLSGDTYQWKELLKGLGFKWARKKKRWFLAPQRKGKRNNNWSMEKIRARHGSVVVTEAPEVQEHALLTA